VTVPVPRVLVLAPEKSVHLTRALESALTDDCELVRPATPAALKDLLPTVDVAVGDWSGRFILDAEAAHWGRSLRLVQQPGVGVEFIDLAAWAAVGVPVANAAGANASAVAEWAVGATIHLLRQMSWADERIRAGEWPSSTVAVTRVRELSALRVGIVGFGPIGRKYAQLVRPFGCALSYWSRTRRPAETEAGAAYRDLGDLLATSDVLVVAVALSAETRGLIGADELARLPEGAVVVNVARGAVLDEVALLRALQSGQLAGAALDVFAREPLALDSPLRSAANLLLSPHISAATPSALERTFDAAAQNVRRALRGEPVLGIVNGPARS
jgi:D-3-phosphoglycerate dehydrogenase / 2-oxoglutarate reductase